MKNTMLILALLASTFGHAVSEHTNWNLGQINSAFGDLALTWFEGLAPNVSVVGEGNPPRDDQDS